MKIDRVAGVQVEETIRVKRPAAELYAYWRRFDQLPRFMTHLKAVDVIDERFSHWSVAGPAGIKLEWDAEMIEDVPNERISWRSVADADVDNAGSVSFRSTQEGQGCAVKVVLTYNPPAGRIGEALAKWLGADPAREIQNDLSHFKEYAETRDIYAVQRPT